MHFYAVFNCVLRFAAIGVLSDAFVVQTASDKCEI